MRETFPEVFSSERLMFERLRYEDAEEIFYTYASKAEATRHVIWPTHNSISDTRKYLRDARRYWNLALGFHYGIRLISNKRLVGSAGINVEGNELQFGYIFSPTVWGAGYATETVKRLTSIMLAIGNIDKIHTIVDIDNIASSRVLEKAGYQMVARMNNHMVFVNQANAVKDCLYYEWPGK